MPEHDAIEAILGPRGALARAIPGYEHRPQQIAMARRVLGALKDRRFLVAEAGTGTGKTLAYLVPAILSGRKVVISTATKNLQEQIVFKDLPLVKQVAGRPFTATLMKGRQNFLCKLKFEDFCAGPEFAVPAEAKRWPALRAWAGSTPTGDRAEANLPDEIEMWKSLSTGSATCLGQKCRLYEDCFVTRMRNAARESDVLVVNHHLFFADLAVRTAAQGAPGAEVIPPYEAVVFDEAHALEDVASEFFAVEMSPLRVAELARDAAMELDLDDRRAEALMRLLDKAQHLCGEVFTALTKLLPKGDRAIRVLPSTWKASSGICVELETALRAVAGLIGDSEDVVVKSLARRAEQMGDDLAFLRRAEDPAFVYWLEVRARAAFLKAAPVDIAKELRERLYGRIDTAIFTSATLATDGKFDFLLRRLGLVEVDGSPLYEVDAAAFDSPFDFSSQAALYLPSHLPEPGSQAFAVAVAEEIGRLCAITGGRAFALFTSLRNMRAAHDALKDRLPWRVLLQGEAPKHRLLELFKAEPAVLFASHSFWEGVDVPGEALSLVVIDKLPFANPQDPIVAARMDHLKSRDRDPFNEYQLPAAVLALRQGFGRLIRTRADRGIVAVLDPRLHTRGYGRAFLDSLPGCPRIVDLEPLRGWWTRQ